MVHLQSPMATIFKTLLLSTKPAQDNSLLPLATAKRILHADGADPYVQVPRVDCAYGVDE